MTAAPKSMNSLQSYISVWYIFPMLKSQKPIKPAALKTVFFFVGRKADLLGRVSISAARLLKGFDEEIKLEEARLFFGRPDDLLDFFRVNFGSQIPGWYINHGKKSASECLFLKVCGRKSVQLMISCSHLLVRCWG